MVKKKKRVKVKKHKSYSKKSKKRTKNLKVVKKNPLQAKKDFEIFAKGVERLKELEQELNNLDTRGFAREEESIRNKLKNVSDIPRIEREIKELRAKIHGRYRPKRRKTSKVIEEIEELQEDVEKLARKKQHYGGIDSGVGALVDTDFNSFLKDIKVKLSERLKDREKQVDDVLERDLQKREQKYREKHNNLIKEFQKKYDSKVKTSLHREVAERLNKLLREKLAKEKVVLGKRSEERRVGKECRSRWSPYH